MKKITILFAPLLISLSLMLVPNLAMAQTNPCAGSPDPVKCGLDQTKQAYPAGATQEQDIGALVHTVINWALYLSAIVAVIFIIIGGFRYITSAGNDATATAGRKTLTNALIGLVIVVLSYMIVQVVYNFLVT